MPRPPLPPPPPGLCLGLLLLSLVAWLPGIVGSGFSFDDLEGVLQNPLVNGTRPMWEALRFDYWHHLGDAGHYRPLTVISLAIDERLFDSWAPGFRATSALLHGLVVLFGALFARHLRPARLAWAGLIGLAIFAIHPALADAVAWISGRSSPLSLLPGVFFGWRLIRAPRPGAARAFACVFAAALLGLLAKEDGLVPAALPLFVLWSARWRPRLAGLFGLALALGLYFWLRNAALGSFLPSAPHAPLAGAALDVRLAAAGGAMASAWSTLLWPVAIPPSWSAADWPTQLTSTRALVGWLPWLAALFAAAATARPRPALAAGLALFAAAWVPVQQWIPAGEVFAPRFLYLPLFFLSLPLGALVLLIARHLVRHRGGTALTALFGLGLALVWIPLAWQAANPYSSLRAYSQATLARFPSDAHAWNGLGLGEEQRGSRARAQQAFERALELDPTYGRAHSNLARLELEAGSPSRARPHFEAAAALGPGNPVAWCNLGSFELTYGSPEESRAAYSRATAIAPGMLTAWRGLTRAELARGDRAAAHAALELARKLAPDDPTLDRLAKRIEALP